MSKITSPTDLKDQLRDRICDVLLEKPFKGMGHVAVSEALVESAFAWRDFNGGIGDTCHASKCLHELVDETGRQHDPEYTPEKLQEYLRKTHKR